MIDKSKTYAVIGASNDEFKYGFKVLVDLKEAGFDVIPVNPNAKEVSGLRCYPLLDALDRKVDVAVFVVQPHVTEDIIEHLPSSIKKVWFQPGAESDKAIRMCKERGIDCVHDDCIMVRRRL